MNRRCYLSITVLAILITGEIPAIAQPQHLVPNSGQSEETLKLHCWNVKKSGWGPCIGGSIPRRLVMVGIGGRFVEINPDSQITTSGVYRSCNELAQDFTLPKTFRDQTKQKCDRLFTTKQNSIIKKGSR